MSHYRGNLRDIEFTLFEVLGRQDVLGTAPYAEVDADVAREMLREVARLAEHELAASFVDSDRNPPVYDPATHSVRIPESFKRSYQAYVDAEWWRMDLPEELGGTVVPPSLRWAIQEFVLGANPAVHMYSCGYAFAHTIFRNGTPEQLKLAQIMVDKHWGGSMVLTEPDAGSDVGAGRAKAVQQPDGTWHINGVKRFITSGEHDLIDNIVHFVLARPEGAGVGTKGLSLFLVPKFHVDLETGELGERNGVFATNVEHKMGLKVSTTCELTFGEIDGIPAVGTLLGDVHDGIAQMFQIIEYARMMVGTKAIATLSSGYLNALAYAKERVQGADLTQMSDKTAPRVTITHHPDVRRSLMTQKAYAEGLRALVLYTATYQDALASARLRGETGEAAELAERVNDLLLPIVKGGGSERSWTLARHGEPADPRRLGLPAGLPDRAVRPGRQDRHALRGHDGHPGAGLLLPQDRAGQGARARAHLGPGAGLRQGRHRRGRHAGPRARAARPGAGGRPGHRRLHGRRAAWRAIPRAVAMSANVYKVGQNTTRLLLACTDLLVGWLLLRQAEVATAALARDDVSAKDRSFYAGKVAAARFFAASMLPKISAERAAAEATDNALMDLDESAF